MGSFACSELARRGLRVIGFDRFHPPHGRGSHSGDTRVFRVAYAEHPDYVPLALRAGRLWDEYSVLGGKRLLTRCGMLSLGPIKSELIKGILNSAALHGLDVAEFSPAEVQHRFPAFVPDESDVGIFEQDAGWIDANAALETAQRIAELSGATLRLDDPVQKWSCLGDHFEISTESDKIAAKKLVITAGAWSAGLLDELNLTLRVERKVLTWVDPIDAALFEPEVCPVFGFSEGFLYGFPALRNHGVKLAVHWRRGQLIEDPNTPVEEATLEDAFEALTIAARRIPRLAGPMPEALNRVKQMKTCLYVMSHDEHFYVDQHPEWPGLVFAAGFSGHGFKFAPAIGEVLADLVVGDVTKVPVDFLRASRLAAN